MDECAGCRDHKWADPQEVVWKDPADKKGYCVFHAPEENKFAMLNGPALSPEEFNRFVYARIKLVIDSITSEHDSATCNLRGVIFPWGIYFTHYHKMNPLPHIDFGHATFCGKVDFSGVVFGSKADFDKTVFNDDVDFDQAVFKYIVRFYETTWGGQVNFTETKFTAADFYKATFSNNVDFYSSTFGSASRFYEVTFNGKADFLRATFGDRADFAYCKASDRAVRMHKLSKESLEHLDFSPVELPQFHFLGCRWPKRLGLETHGYGTADNLLACEELYRSMKQRAAEEHDQPQVSRWHYREKLMGLKQLFVVRLWLAALDNLVGSGSSWVVRANALPRLILYFIPALLRCLFSLTFWYWATSGFGEGVVRAGILLTLLAALPFAWNSPSGTATFQWLWSQAAWLHGAAGQIAPLRNAVNATAAMQFIPFTEDIGGEGWMKVAQAIWHLLIIIQGTLFALAVRNRFRR